MFSGVIHQIAPIKAFSRNVLEISSSYRPELGDSIAVNGACLTAIGFFKGGFALELSAHTQEQIALENYALGERVHIEPALRLDSRLDGHFVQGHIDGIGTIVAIKPSANQVCVEVQASADFLQLCIPKGSIALDGVSLTLSEVHAHSFTLTIIPYTFENTLFATYKTGRRVNLESDMLVRSVAHLLKGSTHHAKSTWQDFDHIVMGY
ncbi:riboflavin synthase [Helicobacter baculiformis]|uniref:Riboflavin synthase n=1 Tax=Helicobacter baculiformis TaxID=427351 RepID=A0ABV7ZET8_9HELI|nr:riboflavin synthase [Helicobacter baculiformis]